MQMLLCEIMDRRNEAMYQEIVCLLWKGTRYLNAK